MNTKGKKQIIAKKMGGQVIGRPTSWSKKVEKRNLELELDEDMFTGADRKKISKTYKSDNIKDKNNWLI